MTIISQSEQAATAGPSSRRVEEGGGAGGDDPLRRKRRELLQQQAQLQEVQRVIGHLQRLQGGGGGGGSGEVIVPFGEAAYVKARACEATQTAFVEVSSEHARLAPSASQAIDGKVAVPVAALLPALVQQRQQYEEDVAATRNEVMRLAQQYFSEHLNEAAGTTAATDKIDTNEAGQALNEEGLPFVDLTEPVADDEPTPGKGVVQPFEPAKKQSKEERKAWMDSVLAQLEQEERGGGGAVSVKETSTLEAPPAATTQPARPNHARLPSSERPLPIKSVLKHTPLPQRFGASGMRKGFLNMNPSSPAAEHSSDPIDQIRYGSLDDAMSNSTSSLGSMAEQLNGGVGDAERMSRSTELASPQAKKKKKTVRIQSPESERRRRPSARDQLLEPLKALPKEPDEDNAMDEAQSIVDLLGIDAIKGHPQYDQLKKEHATTESAPAIPTTSTTKRKLPQGPAVRKDVVERSNSAPKPAMPTAKPPSAFARGFLNVKPKLPSAPRASQGISALERATNNDEALSDERIKQGLPASAPHARPSKAFAAKLEASKRGEQVATIDDEVEELPAKMSKVRFGQDDQGAVAVRVGTAASEASRAATSTADEDTDMVGSDEENELTAMGLDVYDEELDEDQVDALGYFSDEDGDDPDIGFDSDDLVDAVPQFNSDAGDIDNDELRREYERIKANLVRSGAMQARNLTTGSGGGEGSFGGDDDDDDDDDQDFGDGQDLSMVDADDNGGKANVSRFRRERLHRAMMGRRAVSRELGGGAGDSTLVNAGPSMLIPALANVRFPKPKDDGSVPTKAHEIELDGVSDEDDDRLENTMRARLAQREFDDDERTINERKLQSSNEPPRLTATTEAAAAAKPAKKPSLFKSRMQGSIPDDE